MEKTTAASFLNDNDKIEQLSKYLILSLEAHKQGKPKQLNDILEHLLTEQADLQLMKLWLSIFVKILNIASKDPKDPKLDCSLLINFILYRSKWLCSNSNHIAIYDQYEKFCFATMALFKSYIPIIFKLLLENLIPKEFHEEGKKEQAINIIIGNNTFPTLTDLKSYINALLRNPKYDDNEAKSFVELEHDHAKFMVELFNFHPKADQKMKNIKKILLGINLSRKKPTRCFFIEKTTGEKEDISYLKACSTASEIFAAKKGQNLLKEKQEELVNKVMGTIDKILKMYPLTLQSFSTHLNEVFPHRRQEILLQRIFFTNILKLSLKIEKVRMSILNICFERLIQIDAEIKIDALNNELSIEMSKKLDWLLLIFFDYIDYIFEIRQRSEHNGFGVIPLTRSSATVQEYSEKMLDKFYDLVDLFQRHLLMTYRPRYVQFIFFYLCSYTEIYPDFMQTFLSRLIINIKKEEETRLIRINSANYLRSIAIRAKFIPGSIIQKTLDLLLNHVKSCSKQAKKKLAQSLEDGETNKFEVINLEASSRYSDIKNGTNNAKEIYLRELFLKFDIYYHTITAIAYIICEHKAETTEIDSENYQKFTNIILRYNKYLHILEFIPLKLISRLQVLNSKFGNEEIEALLVAELSNDGVEARGFRGHQLIEDYLPFDPNFLFHSRKVIEPNYNFLDDENRVLEEMKGDFDETNLGGKTKSVIIDDTLNETESENYSSISKHDTESSVGAIDMKLNKVNSKRKLDDLEVLDETQKKVIKDNGDYRNITVN